MNPITPETAPEGAELYVFTYGTLRPGMGLDRVLRGAVITAETATVDGYRLHANTSRSYPYLVADERSTTTGTLYLLRNGQEARSAHRIELGAGYDATEVDAVLADGTSVKALAWEWRKPWGLGELIPSGDWCIFEEQERARWHAETLADAARRR
jgi:gamma-glutamylcyclotransferase (GGCT)/AIG2-like uncharacterized protein YtfP